MAHPHLNGAGRKWIKVSGGWREETKRSEVIAESIQIGQVKKIIELFLKNKQQDAFKQLYSCLSAAPVSKCSAKENVMWLQVSSSGSNECHGYSTLGELLRRLHLTGSVWQQGRFSYVMGLTERIVRNELMSLSGTSRKHLFNLVETLVQRVIESHEKIRQMKKIVQMLFRSLMKKNYSFSKLTWYAEVDHVRNWTSRLNLLTIVPRIDRRLTIPDLPIEVQRHIIRMLDDHEDIESLSRTSKTLKELCNESTVWKSLCVNQYNKKQLEECETVLERRRLKSLNTEKRQIDITWRIKYHFMLKRFEKEEEFADPLLLCTRCSILFWKDSGHPCVGEKPETTYEHINPKRLISFF